VAAVLLWLVNARLGIAQVIPLGDWTAGRSTYYCTSSSGACGFQYFTQQANSWPFEHTTAPNQAFYNNGQMCGACFEVSCTSQWNSSDTSWCKDQTVVVQVADECPVQGNEKYCSGDIVHFDLSSQAFAVIANPAVGVIATRYRRVACEPKENLVFLTGTGLNSYYFAGSVPNAGYIGTVDSVSVNGIKATLGSAAWTAQDPSKFQIPLTVSITSGQQTITVMVQTITDSTPFQASSNFQIKGRVASGHA